MDKSASAQVYQQTIVLDIGESVASANMWRGPLLLAFLFHCSSAEPVTPGQLLSSRGDVVSVESLRRDVRESAPLALATEVEDLLGEGNAPAKDQAPKKRMKNASGTFLPTYLSANRVSVTVPHFPVKWKIHPRIETRRCSRIIHNSVYLIK